MDLKKLSIQEYFSIGYIYLIILGIISDVILYNFLNINIFNYSSILDVLITPISIITEDIRVFILFSIITYLAYLYVFKLLPKMHVKLRDKKWYTKLVNIEKEDIKIEKLKQKDKSQLIGFVAFFVLSIFLGFGVGRGYITKSKLEANELKTTHQLVFQDEKTIKVNIIGQNESYLFYVEEGKDKVSIAPISYNIKKIEKLEVKK